MGIVDSDVVVTLPIRKKAAILIQNRGFTLAFLFG